MLKRIAIFLLTNIAVLATIMISLSVIQAVFGINVTGYGWSYLGIFIFALVVWFAGSFISLALSKYMAKMAYKINLATKQNFDALDEKQKLVFTTVEDLAQRHNIKTPEIGFYISPEPNAFATGASKNSSLVAVSSGLLDMMNADEIEWVVAHEMAHVLNGDMVTMALVQWVLNTFVVFFSRIIANIIDTFMQGEEESTGPSWVYYVSSIVLDIIFGIFASLVAMKFSRYREFRADYGSAQYVWKRKMIAALKALEWMQNRMLSSDDSKMATMKISTKNKKSGILSLFSSHPDLWERITALENANI
mgnify:CR=1 FL=1